MKTINPDTTVTDPPVDTPSAAGRIATAGLRKPETRIGAILATAAVGGIALASQTATVCSRQLPPHPAGSRQLRAALLAIGTGREGARP
jgi:hypothetical protein